MVGDRLARILAELSSGGETDPEPARLCEVSADVTRMSGAGIMLMSGEVPRGEVCTTDEVSATLEELQYMLGEGPCVDAYGKDRPVVEPDLADPVTSRWVAFTPRAVAAGARAVFGFPLQVGAVRMGALNLYRDAPGPLSDDQHADALVMAGVTAQALLVMQSQAPPGSLGAELASGVNLRSVVHQASGMVSAQLGVSVGEAFVRLRARAFGNDRPLGEIADDIVQRRLRFDDGDLVS